MRNIKAFAFLSFVLFTSSVFNKSYAQQEPQFTMFWNIYSIQNPAATGIFKKHSASVEGRNQWVGLSGNPKTITAFYDRKLENINSGIGGNYMLESIGPSFIQKLRLNYSYQLNLENERVMSIGLAAGLNRMTIDFSKLFSQTPDPAIPNTKKSDNMFDLAVGAMYKTPKLLLGASMTQINEAISSAFYYKNVRHLFLSGSYVFPVSALVELKPGCYIKTEFSSTQIDLNVLTIYKKIYWTGLSWRKNDAICMMAGIDINEKYRIGYSYDYTTSSLSKFSNGSHEFVLALMLD